MTKAGFCAHSVYRWSAGRSNDRRVSSTGVYEYIRPR